MDRYQRIIHYDGGEQGIFHMDKKVGAILMV